jgi:hypothetical protein
MSPVYLARCVHCYRPISLTSQLKWGEPVFQHDHNLNTECGLGHAVAPISASEAFDVLLEKTVELQRRIEYLEDREKET